MKARSRVVMVCMAVALGAAQAATVTLTNSDAFGTSSFNSGLNWDDGLPPDGANDYRVTNGLGLRTPDAAGSFTFAGNALAFGDGTTSGALLYKGTGGGTDTITITNAVLNFGTIGNSQGGNFFLAGDIALGSGGGFFDQGGPGRAITITAPLGGVGSLTTFNSATNGGGTVILAANNVYAGSTIIATGTLQVGNAGTAGTLGSGNVTNRGTLAFIRSDSYTVTNAVSGPTGNLHVRGGDMTLLNVGATNFQLQVPDAAGAVANVVLNLSNSVVQVLANAAGNCNIGGVGNPAASGTINMEGGYLTIANEIFIAAGNGNSRGYFNLISGNVLVSNWTGVGRGASGTGSYGELNIHGGSWSNVAFNNITVASFLGNTGIVRVTGGRVYAQNGIYVGESGNGALAVGNSGVVDVNFMTLGDRNTGSGTAVISGGVVQVRTSLGVANGAATAGTLNLGAGELVANTIYRTGTASINLAGGVIRPYNSHATYSAPMNLTTDASYGGTGTVTFAALTPAGGTNDIAITGTLSGDGALTKTGGGALNLGGNNDYTGATTVEAGYLYGTGLVLSAVTLNNGAVLGPNSLLYPDSTFTLVSSATLNAGAGLSAFLNGPTPTLQVVGALTGAGDHRIDLLPSSQGVATGVHTIVSYGSLASMSFTTGRVPTGVQGYINVNLGAQTVEFVVTNAGGGLIWSGAVDNNWDVDATTNWIIAGSATPFVFRPGDPVQFNDTGLNTAIAIPTAITPGRIAVSNDVLPYSFAGSPINGPAGITKEGTNSLILATANAYTGTNRVGGGTLVASNASALGSTAGPTIVEGGTLDIGGQILGQEQIVIAGSGAGGNGAIINGGAVQINALQYVTLAGNASIGGSNRWDIRAGIGPFLDLNGFQLNKIGPSFIGLVGAMVTNTGDIVIDAGVLSPHAGGTLSGAGNVYINSGGTFAPAVWGTTPTITKAVTLNGGTLRLDTGGGAALTIASPVTLNATANTVDTPDQALTLNNTISGVGGFTKTGANQLILTGTNTYEGPTVISGGGVLIGNGVLSAGTLGGGQVVNNGQLIFNRPDSHVVTNLITGSGQILARRGETTLLGTAITNHRFYVLDSYIPAGNAIVNVSNSTLHIVSNAFGNFSVGLSTNPTSTGIVNMASGTIRSSNEVWIAAGGGSSRGIFNLLGGDVSVMSWTAIGRGNGGSGLNNYGELNISGGTWSNIGPNHISIASFANNTGRVTVSNGRLYAQNSIYIAEGGNGSMAVSGGAVDPNILSIGQVANGVGRLELSGGTVATRNALTVGNAAGSHGIIYQTGGSLSSGGGDSRFANNATAHAYMRATSGTFTVVNNLQIGASGVGILEIDGNAAASANASFPVIGRFVGGRGILDVAGGAFTHNNAGTFLIVGEQGTGVLNVRDAGTVTVHSARTGDGLRIAHTLGTGVVNLAAGGTLVAPAVSRAAAAANIGTLNFHGGTLRANNNNTAFLQGLSAAHVFGNGATIDDGGFTVTVAQPLLAPTGSGITAVPVLTTGAGYKCPPYVQIIGGGGSNATALAQIDMASGALTNILITNPGTDYTNFPAVTLVGGAPATAATLGTPAFAIHGSGGLVKLGAGTLTLSGANTFTGNVTVSNGTLALSGATSLDLNPQIILQTGATLSATARTDGTLTLGSGQTLIGAGTVNGTVTNAGTIAPGFSPGLLTVNGDYVQTGVLDIQIGGAATPGVDHDELVVNGNITFGGTLNVTLINGYTGAVGDTFFPLIGISGSGAFAATNLPALGAGMGWNLTYMGGALAMLSITSLPAASGYDVFALQVTNPADRGYQNDPDGDGYANLLEYVTGSNPTNADQQARLGGTRSNGVLALRFKHDTSVTDATLYVEAAYASTNDAVWSGLATNSGGSWGGATNVTVSGGSPADVTAFDTEPSATNRFLRLRVTRP